MTIFLVLFAALAIFALGTHFGKEWEQGTIRELIRIENVVETETSLILGKIKTRINL